MGTCRAPRSQSARGFGPKTSSRAPASASWSRTSPLHAAHHREDVERPDGQLPPFGRPGKQFMSLSGYHTDIYCGEIYHLDIGFAYGQYGI